MVAGTPRARSAQSVNQASAAEDAHRRPSHRTLRAELAHLYADAYDRTCRHDTLTALEAIVAWLRRVERHDGSTFVRSMPQAFRGIGWPTTGSVKADRSRHRENLTRRLNMLIEMGVVESWEAVLKPSREGRGILVALRRDSSVGRARLQSCSSPSSRVRPPLREKSPSNRSEGLKEVEKRQARATRAREGRAGHRATAKAIRQLTAAGEGSGAELVAALPELKSLHPAVLLRAATYTYAPRPSAGWAKHWTPRLSLRSRLAAESACDQLDRYDGRGSGAAAILDLAAGGWRLHTPGGRGPRFVEPRTPGVLVKGLRQRARLARRAARMRDELYAASEGWT